MKKAIEFVDQIIEQQRPLWEQAMKDIGIDPDAKPRPGSLEERLCQLSPEEFLKGTPRMQALSKEIQRMKASRH